MTKIVFLCGAKDFHAMDKVRLISNKLGQSRVVVLTDTISGEGQKSKLIVGDRVYQLISIDKLTLDTTTKFSNTWRNVVKFLILPLQVQKVKNFYAKNTDCIYHALPLYYMLLCYYSRVPYIGTPQASEVLVRPQASKIYSYFAKKAIGGANVILVDSVKMQTAVQKLFDVKTVVLKNGFNTTYLMSLPVTIRRANIVSIRAAYPLYNIDKIIESRNQVREAAPPPLRFIFPAQDENYLTALKKQSSADDLFVGRLEKDELYQLLTSTLLVVSIPSSDSSPRSVYESIFAGAAVATLKQDYYNELPECMKQRIILVDLEDKYWFGQAVIEAKRITQSNYAPSREALEMCDENFITNKIIQEIYKIKN